MEFSEEKFPDYCLGITYFMNVATTWKLFRTFEETFKNHYIWIEDVYLTGKILEAALNMDFPSKTFFNKMFFRFN